MPKLVWDNIAERLFEVGVDHGVLYTPTSHGVYGGGVVWNGLVSVTEKPTGAEANDQYADNIKYLTIISAEDFEATIEAFTYPKEFEECDGSVEIAPGVFIGQQDRKPFGMSYRTKLGNDVDNIDYGYKLHLLYGMMATPTEKGYETINDSPEAITFSWDLTSIPVPVEGHKPTAHVVIDSTLVDTTTMKQLEAILYGEGDNDPRLPDPSELATMFATGPSGTFMSAREKARARAEAAEVSLPQFNQ